MSMQTLQIHTQQSAASRASAVTRFTPSKGCRSVFAQLPVRPVAVHGSRQVQQVAPASTVHTEQPKTAVKPVKTLKQHVVELVQTGAKAAAVLGVAVALVLGRCDAAHAARSAGRAGGFSAPSASRSYSGGGFSGGMRSYSGGYSGGISSYSAPLSTYRAPIIMPSPPVVYGGPSVMVSPGAAVVTAGPDIIDIAIISIFLIMAAGAATSVMRDTAGFDGASVGGRPTLTRVQVGLVSLARELKHDLDSIATRADTSSSRGLHHLLQEVVLALLRNPRYCVYGAASKDTTSSLSSLENKFNAASMKERSKFEQETLVNVAGVAPRRSSYRSSSKGSMPDELIVVTLLVATTCAVDVPAKINNLQDLKQALQALGSVGSEQVVGVELLWTPQAEGDYYTKDEIISDYPHLRQL